MLLVWELSSVTCRISTFNGLVPLGVTPLLTVESIPVVKVNHYYVHNMYIIVVSKYILLHVIG